MQQQRHVMLTQSWQHRVCQHQRCSRLPQLVATGAGRRTGFGIAVCSMCGQLHRPCSEAAAVAADGYGVLWRRCRCRVGCSSYLVGTAQTRLYGSARSRCSRCSAACLYTAGACISGAGCTAFTTTATIVWSCQARHTPSAARSCCCCPCWCRQLRAGAAV